MVPSKLWRSFTKIDQISAACNECKQVIKTSGNTSNLKAHLDKQTGFDAPKGNKPEQQKMSKFVSNSGANKNTCRKDVSNDPDDPDYVFQEDSSISSAIDISSIASSSKTIVSIPNSSPHQRQQNINEVFKQMSSMAVGGTQHKCITDAIAYFLCKDNKAFSTIEGKGFRNMVNKLNPLYKVPCRNTIKT
ncbi:uncharacterized protein LOC112681168 [Sipha flava]|uniref:Uncharacterized protein LOC112681168 n=1 Tax=Sipha flava TaxID=143950 RepID=A0A8B8F8P9_9HEMI|nr:uncharacterized protein LOC112681168 [Sipha flava]